MFKKCILVFFSVLWLCSVCLFVYRISEPEKDEFTYSLVSSVDFGLNNPLSYRSEDSLNQIKYYFFCAVSDQDCVYVNDTILKNLASEMEVKEFSFLEFVDAQRLYGDWTPSKLKSVWGFENYPAFVAAKDLGNSFEILNVVEWTEAAPLDKQAVKDWMILNNLWTGPIDEQKDIIDKPIDE